MVIWLVYIWWSVHWFLPDEKIGYELVNQNFVQICWKNKTPRQAFSFGYLVLINIISVTFYTIVFREVNGPHSNTAGATPPGATAAGATPPGATAAGAAASSNASTLSTNTRQSQRQTPTRPPGPAAQSNSNTPAGIKTERICVLFMYTNAILILIFYRRFLQEWI